MGFDGLKNLHFVKSNNQQHREDFLIQHGGHRSRTFDEIQAKLYKICCPEAAIKNTFLEYGF
jgi:hypothetical protein